jgi:hypothetical protein
MRSTARAQGAASAREQFARARMQLQAPAHSGPREGPCLLVPACAGTRAYTPTYRSVSLKFEGPNVQQITHRDRRRGTRTHQTPKSDI